MDERRIVLLGRTGSGKSTSGNTILGRDVFVSSACCVSVTKQCERGRATRRGYDLQVIDSPGMFDTNLSDEVITREIVKCIGMTAPGPHVFVIVLRIDRFTAEEQATVDHLRRVFGDGMQQHLMVLFTRKDDLEHDGKTIQQYVSKVPVELKMLLSLCNNRYVAFNNRGTPDQKEADVFNFLSLVESIVQGNSGRFYTSEMYEQAETAMRKREEQLRRDHDEQVARNRRKIEEEYEQRLADIDANHKDKTAGLQDQIRAIEDDKRREKEDLQHEVKQLRELLEEVKKNGAEARETARRRVAQELESQQSQPDFREQVRQEVSTGARVMDFLKSLGPVIKDMISQLGGSVATGISEVIQAKFSKKAQKIRDSTDTKT